MLTSRQISRNLNGIPTEIVMQAFADRILVLITQMGKVGTLIQASMPSTTPLLPAAAPNSSETHVHPLPPPPSAIQLTPLFGSAPSERMQTLHSLYAAQIATIIWTAESDGPLEVDRRSVVVGIALRKFDGASDELSQEEREVFRGVMDMLRDSLAGI
ncbi:hypothetical protein PILCRDRAFT_815633 [Piloderma croceum F 1598]|uniref:Uncharacterized protein n=1 Tax=Piloderma croceum (strain F 1598) TaxID=765440 RepID=A0A0C3BL64_PILCF|nr:hypothetical protein PILCRDRAFT_815633 [Piloderma croceum F 1598]